MTTTPEICPRMNRSSRDRLSRSCTFFFMFARPRPRTKPQISRATLMGETKVILLTPLVVPRRPSCARSWRSGRRPCFASRWPASRRSVAGTARPRPGARPGRRRRPRRRRGYRRPTTAATPAGSSAGRTGWSRRRRVDDDWTRGGPRLPAGAVTPSSWISSPSPRPGSIRSKMSVVVLWASSGASDERRGRTGTAGWIRSVMLNDTKSPRPTANSRDHY